MPHRSLDEVVDPDENPHPKRIARSVIHTEMGSVNSAYDSTEFGWHELVVGHTVTSLSECTMRERTRIESLIAAASIPFGSDGQNLYMLLECVIRATASFGMYDLMALSRVSRHIRRVALNPGLWKLLARRDLRIEPHDWDTITPARFGSLCVTRLTDAIRVCELVCMAGAEIHGPFVRGLFSGRHLRPAVLELFASDYSAFSPWRSALVGDGFDVREEAPHFVEIRRRGNPSVVVELLEALPYDRIVKRIGIASVYSHGCLGLVIRHHGFVGVDDIYFPDTVRFHALGHNRPRQYREVAAGRAGSLVRAQFELHDSVPLDDVPRLGEIVRSLLAEGLSPVGDSPTSRLVDWVLHTVQ